MELRQRKITRLAGYDYASGGAYFVTICTKNGERLLGKIENKLMIYNKYGKIAWDEIYATNELRKNANIEIVQHIIMPNHIHLIIEIVGTRRAVSENQGEQFSKPTKQSISTVVRAYKSAVTKRIHENSGHGTPCPYGSICQPRFYEHIIRNEEEYETISQYIERNPAKWEEDRFYTYGLT